MINKAILKVIVIALVSLVFSACSSQPAMQANFYLLNDASNQANSEAQEFAPQNSFDHTILVNKIHLSDYLRQPNIAMQLNDHQLYYSNNHLWAEKLDSAIAKSLLNDLNQKSSNLNWISHDSPVINRITAKLTVEIEHFIATVNSKVVLSGRFWLVSNNAEDVKMSSKSIKRNFRYSLSLEKDGYPHSVSKMRLLLALLSDEITVLVEELISK